MIASPSDGEAESKPLFGGNTESTMDAKKEAAQMLGLDEEKAAALEAFIKACK